MRTTTRARALARRTAQACERVQPHRGTPILGHAGPTLWFPQALGAGVATPEPPDVKRKLLEFQERERTEPGDWALSGPGRGLQKKTPAITFISGRRPQHSVSRPRVESAATRDPRLGSRSWELHS